MKRLAARGKYLFEGSEKFYAKGVSYGPFAPNSRGERYPEPEQAERDLALMGELGATVVRIYVPPPRWLLEAARRHRLRLMVGMPWPFHMMFLDSAAMQRDIRATIRKSVAELSEFRDVVFAYSLGNEIRSDVARWHGPRKISRFLAELYQLGKDLDPEGLFTYSNYPSVEYLDLSFLDLICFNVYLHREADYRRYLTHLLALSADKPLVLSETGMDTIREGEAHQAELLSWQARAAFEMGLAGFIIFAFTDAWHTGGAEITDWAFGLVTRERGRKAAFAAVAEVFRQPLPPALPRLSRGMPRVSVIVAAYNEERTIESCLRSLQALDYPDYEVIVVDDGSTDRTRELVLGEQVNLMAGEHRGLAAARNLGVAAASGELVAFIDADAIADRDWLYHLVESMTRHGTGAVGGPSFAPPADNPWMAALAAAPGAAREVRAAEERLAQLCGCNMALDKGLLERIGGFDAAFTAAADDTDLSIRLEQAQAPIAYAPGAVVLHRRRTALRSYLTQQAGYGRGEAILARKYPRLRQRLYGGEQSFWSRLGGPRVYYGAMGRGLFQSLYRSDRETGLYSLLSLPVLGEALFLLVLGSFAMAWLAVGLLCLAVLLAMPLAHAAAANLAPPYRGLGVRARLALAALAGPLVRSAAYWRAWFAAHRAAPAGSKQSKPGLHLHGRLVFRLPAAASGAAGDAASGDELAAHEPWRASLHEELFARGLTVAKSEGLDDFDVMVTAGPLCTVPINLLFAPERIELRWRSRFGWRGLGMLVLWLLVPLWLTALGRGWSAQLAIDLAAGALVLAAGAALTLPNLRALPVALEEAALAAARALAPGAEPEPPLAPRERA